MKTTWFSGLKAVSMLVKVSFVPGGSAWKAARMVQEGVVGNRPIAQPVLLDALPRIGPAAAGALAAQPPAPGVERDLELPARSSGMEVSQAVATRRIPAQDDDALRRRVRVVHHLCPHRILPAAETISASVGDQQQRERSAAGTPCVRRRPAFRRGGRSNPRRDAGRDRGARAENRAVRPSRPLPCCPDTRTALSCNAPSAPLPCPGEGGRNCKHRRKDR